MNKMIYSNQTTDILGPNVEMVGPLNPGGKLICKTNPGCWGNMITPKIKSWHEVNKPVEIKGAKPGDAVVIKIKKINILSRATSSGTDEPQKEYFHSDSGIDSFCPVCEKDNPETYIEGTGQNAVKCAECGNPVTPFRMPNGYTMLFSGDRKYGITVDDETSDYIAKHSSEFSELSQAGMQHSINVYNKSDIQGLSARVIPMIGNIGTSPARDLPSSHNAGDFAQFLVGASHQYACQEEDLDARTDGHMDINSVREGTVIIAPVKIKGAGVYIGDIHAMQGGGEIAGHTTDVAAEVEVKIDLLKNINNEGPILLPLIEDLHPLTKPYSLSEKEQIKREASNIGLNEIEVDFYPLQMVGSGANLNKAIDDGLQKLARLLNYSLGEVKNRVTINGNIEIGRAPGVVKITMLTPLTKIKEIGLEEIVLKHFDN